MTQNENSATEKHSGNEEIVDEQWWMRGKSYCYVERVSGVTDSRRTAEHRERLAKNQR